jgi:hypothetical protein
VALAGAFSQRLPRRFAELSQLCYRDFKSRKDNVSSFAKNKI